MLLHFSALAAGAVGVLLVSGGFLAWKHVGSWPALFGTAYGLVLLAKVGLALPAFGVAGVNLLFVKPKLEAAFDHPGAIPAAGVGRRFRRLVVVEALFALLVLAMAGLLTDLQRGQEAPLLASRADRLTMTAPADDLTVTMTMEPALVGQNRLELAVTGADGAPVQTLTGVEVSFAYLGQSVGGTRAEAVPLGGGRYRLDGNHVSLVGPWQVEATLRREGRFDAFAPFRVEAGAGGRIRPLRGETGFFEQAVTFFNRNSLLLSGLALVGFALAWYAAAGRAAWRAWHLVPLLLPAVIALWLGVGQLRTFSRDFTPALFVTNPILPDGASITRGRELYQANCVLCHGPEGRGDGSGAVGLEPPPADFAAGHTANHRDGDLFFWIQQGIPESAMPAFGAKLSDEEIWHLVNYVRRLSARGG
ncbi:MAG: hypothetical protein D6796_13840 [Caldilineae bacterium]|nr:MAG: hypothetical protein D6796_13840 [Caldilineae bacterium]